MVFRKEFGNLWMAKSKAVGGRFTPNISDAARKDSRHQDLVLLFWQILSLGACVDRSRRLLLWRFRVAAFAREKVSASNHICRLGVGSDCTDDRAPRCAVGRKADMLR